MTYHVDAIYDNGVFRPLEPLPAPDQSRVKLTVEISTSRPVTLPADVESASPAVESQQRAMRELDAELADMPDLSPDDGLTGADHDQILYGRPA